MNMNMNTLKKVPIEKIIAGIPLIIDAATKVITSIRKTEKNTPLEDRLMKIEDSIVVQSELLVQLSNIDEKYSQEIEQYRLKIKWLYALHAVELVAILILIGMVIR